MIKRVLGTKVKEAIISSKLVNSPACISTASGSLNLRMEKFLKERNQLQDKATRIVEVNPNHIVWSRIKSNIKNKTNDSTDNDIINVIYTQACLIEGDSIVNPTQFAHQINNLLSKIK